MIIQCDKCRTKFRIADAKVKAGGVKVRCSRCAHVFHAATDPGQLHKKFTDKGPETARVDTSLMDDLVRSSTRPTPAEELPPPERATRANRIPASSTQAAAAALGFAGATNGPNVDHEAVTHQAAVSLPSFPNYPDDPLGRQPTLQGPPPTAPPPSAAPPSAAPPSAAPPVPAPARGFAEDLLSAPATGFVPPPAGYSTPPPGFDGADTTRGSGDFAAHRESSGDFDFDSPLARNTLIPEGSGDVPLGSGPPPALNEAESTSIDLNWSTDPAAGIQAAQMSPAVSGAGQGMPVRPKGLQFKSAPPGGVPAPDFEDRFPAPSGELPKITSPSDDMFPGPDFPPPADPSQVGMIVSNSGDIPNFLPSGSLDDDPFANIDIDAESAPPSTGYQSLEGLSDPSPFDEATPHGADGGAFGNPLGKIELGQAGLQDGTAPVQVMTTAVAAGYTSGGTGTTLDLYAQRAAGPLPTVIGALLGLSMVLVALPDLGRPLVERVLPSGSQAIKIVTGDTVVTGAVSEVRAVDTRVIEYPVASGDYRLVVSGTARNLSDTSFDGLEAVAVALDGEQIVARAKAPLGRPLEPRTVREAPDAQSLSAAYAEGSLALAAKSDQPFVVVFAETPPRAEELRFRVAFIRAETAQKPPKAEDEPPSSDGT